MKLLRLAALGAAAYYFLDKQKGTERRSNVKNMFNNMMNKSGGMGGSDTGMGGSDTGMGMSGSSSSGMGQSSDPDLLVVDKHGIQSHSNGGQM